MTYPTEPADIAAAAAAEQAARRCPTHDCIIDDFDPCDFCQADTDLEAMRAKTLALIEARADA